MSINTAWLQHRNHLLNFINQKINNPEDAKDVLQDVLLKASSKMDSVSDQKSLVSWLFQISRNAISDYYRQSNKANLVTLPDEVELESELALNSSVKDELLKCLMPFVSQLPQPQQQLLLDIELSELSQKQYAEQQNINYSTLKSQVNKARIAMRDLYQQCCSFEFDKQGNLAEYKIQSPSCDKCN